MACTPASGWEKGQVENQVGVIRRRFFVPRPKFKSYAELNAWLQDRCLAWAKTHPHPEMKDKAIWDVFEEERASLIPYVGPFDGFHAVPAAVSKTCLVRFDKNRYIVIGAAALAVLLFNDLTKTRAVYNLKARSDVPFFKLGGRLCARRSTLLAWIRYQEETAEKRAFTDDNDLPGNPADTNHKVQTAPPVRTRRAS